MGRKEGQTGTKARRTPAWALTLGLLLPIWAHAARTIVEPDDVLRQLKAGNSRYVRGKSSHPNLSSKRRAEIAQKQFPSAVILGCSDSRVPPELIFDTGLGDLFVVRTAGEVVGNLELASIEYAIEHLGASLIVVLGHERCGAVKAAIQALHPAPTRAPQAHPAAEGEGEGHAEGEGEGEGHAEGEGQSEGHAEGEGQSEGHAKGEGEGQGEGHAKAEGEGKRGAGQRPADNVDSPAEEPRDHIEALVAALTPAVRDAERKRESADPVDAAVIAQVKLTVGHLVQDSPLIKAYLVAGRIRILGARYDLDTGEVRVLR